VKTKTLFAFLFFLLIIPLVSSYYENYTSYQDSEYYCDGSYSVNNVSTREFNETDWTYINFYYSDLCDYGCEDGYCKPASIMSEELFALLGSLFSILLVVGAINKNKFFSFIAGMLILIMGVYITSEGMVIDEILYEDTLIRVVGIVLIMFSIFLFYSFIIDVNDTRKGNRGEFDE